MSYLDHYTIFYSVMVGLTVTLYAKKWGELLQVRRYSLYSMVPLFWSIAFLLLLLQPYQTILEQEFTPNLLSIQTILPCCYYVIGMLLFPDTQRLDIKDKFAYLDYYEHFRKQIPWIMGVALFAFILNFLLFWNVKASNLGLLASLGSFLSFQYNFIAFGVLLVAFFAEHKGLLLSLAWILIGLLISFH